MNFHLTNIFRFTFQTLSLIGYSEVGVVPRNYKASCDSKILPYLHKQSCKKVQRGWLKVNSRAPRHNLFGLQDVQGTWNPVLCLVSASWILTEHLKPLLRPSRYCDLQAQNPASSMGAPCRATSQPTWLPNALKRSSLIFTIMQNSKQVNIPKSQKQC